MRPFALLAFCTLLVAIPLTDAKPQKEPPAAPQTGWPIFRGNALQTGVANTVLPDKLEVRWVINLKKGIDSTAAIVNDTIYVGCFDEHLHAIDLATGASKWKTKLGPITAAPTVYDGKIFVGDEDGMFYCVDAADGKKIWDFETGGQITGGASCVDGKVIFGAHDSTLYCLSIQSKEVLWKVKIEGPVNGSAIVANGQTFVAGCDRNLHVIELATGKTLAKVELSGQAAATAAIVGDNLYIGNMNNEFQEINLKKKEVQWTYSPKRGQPFYSSAAVTDRFVIAGNRDRRVHALDRLKGTPVWSFACDGQVDCSPVVVANRVYFGSTRGTFYVVDIEKGTEIQSLPLGQGIVASPAVANGLLVIGTTDGMLYCLGKK